MLPTHQKMTAFFRSLTFELRGAPMMKSEQRATRDETRDLAMPRQGVSLFNVMLDHGWMPHKTHTRPKKPEDNVICSGLAVKHYP